MAAQYGLKMNSGSSNNLGAMLSPKHLATLGTPRVPMFKNASKQPPATPSIRSARSRSKYEDWNGSCQSAASLTEWEEKHAREVFQAYDYDGSGSIDRTELQEMLMEQQWCMDAKALHDFIKGHVQDDVEEVDFDKFLEIYSAILARQPTSVRRKREHGRIRVEDMYELEASARHIFENMDADGTGYLEEDEMREVMRESGLPDTDGDNYEAVVVEHMRLFDTNKDGQISFEEFVLYRNAVLSNFFNQAGQGQPEKASEPDGNPWAESLFCN